jgi:hypothetical protein
MMNQSEDMMNNNPSSNSNLYEDAVDREDLARSNVTSANIYRNLLLQERDEREQAALRIGLRKAIVKGRLKNAVIVLHRQAEVICSCNEFLNSSNITTAMEIRALNNVAKTWNTIRKMIMDPRILRVRHLHVMEAYAEVIINYVRLLDSLVDIMKDLINSREAIFIRHLHLTSERERDIMDQIDQMIDVINTEYHW